jgi:hypothetical protein
VRSALIFILWGYLCALRADEATNGPLALEATQSIGVNLVRRGTNSWFHLRKAEGLSSGVAVKTDKGAQASVDLSFDRQAQADVRLHLCSNSLVEISNLSGDCFNCELSISAGRLYGRVHLHCPSAKFEIRFSEGVVGILGSADFAIGSDGMVAIFSGAAVEARADPKTHMVQTFKLFGGEQFQPEIGHVTALSASKEKYTLNFFSN